MPTENRSSNTEMVSVPRSLAERIKQTCMFTPAENDYEDLRVAIGKSAPQPHPEPIAWMVGTAIWWTKEEAERDAKATGLPVVGLGPMTGAAAVERLRGENEQLREVIKHSDSNIQRQSLRISNQRAQLAERDALLREALEFIDDGVGRSDAEWRLIKKLRAALSPDGAASATDEPYQGIPGTSFQRLNALANQGE
ncbi:hypothetical protein IRZ70_12255 [Pseudomonas monteilii]|nr:hypothetical protein [Pseudomonas monteilii]